MNAESKTGKGTFADRWTVVVGASSGIGAAVSQHMLSNDARVVAIGRSRERLISLSSRFPRAHVLLGDVSRPGEVRRLAGAVEAVTPRVDHLVISSGILKIGRLGDISEEEFDSVVSTNLKAPLFLIQAFLPVLRRGEGKSVVVLSSSLAHRGACGLSVYCASKGGVSSMVRAIAVELAPCGIRVNAVSPGHVDTPMISGLLSSPGSRAAVERRYPLGRIGSAEDVAALVAFLLSDASGWITGSDYVIDGGRMSGD